MMPDMTDRWFTDDELSELSRPTMDRAIEALDAGDVETARSLCEEMKHEWLMLHDLMVGGMAGLITFVQDRLGDEGVRDAWTDSNERGWKRHVEAINRLDRPSSSTVCTSGSISGETSMTASPIVLT